MVVVRKLQAVVEADGISKFESDMAGAKSSLFNFKNVAGLTGGALAGLAAGGLAASISAASKFQNSMVELEKVTSPETADAMNDSLLEMAETIPIAQSGLADIAADAGRFGVEGPENIEKFTRSVAKMAVATNLSTNEAGEAFAKLAELTETPIPKMENLGSAINALSNNFATSASEIVDNMMRSSAAMSQFGLTQTEIAGFAAAINEVSESSERAGTRLRRLVQEISNPKKIHDMARALGMTVKEYKRMQKNNPRKLLMQMIKGFKEGGKTANILNKNLSTTSRQALAGLSQNLDGLRDALGLSAKAFKENTSLQSEFETASKTLDNQVTLLLNTLRGVAIDIGSVLLPAVTEMVKAIRGAVQTFSRWNDATDGILGPATLLSTLIGGLTIAVWAFAPAIGAAVTALAGLAIPIAAVVAGIAVLTTAIVGLHKLWTSNFMGIRTTTIRIFNAIKSAIQTAMNFIMNNIINPIVSRIRKVWNRHGDKLRREARETWTAITKAFNELKTIIWPIIQTFVDQTMRVWNMFGDEIMLVAQFAFEHILGVIETVMDGILTAISLIMNLIQQDWEGAWNDIRGFLERTSEKMLSFARHWGGLLLDWLAGLVGDAIDWIADLDRRMTRKFKNMLDAVIRDVQNWSRDLVGEIKGAVEDGVEAVKDFTESFKDAGQGLIDAVIGGIQDKADELKSSVENTLKPVTDLWPSSDAKEGPFSNLTAYGAAVPETFAKGMESNKQPMIEAADALGKAGLPSPDARGTARRRQGGGKTTIFNVDVNVPEGVNPDTAARTFTDEIKSRNWN